MLTILQEYNQWLDNYEMLLQRAQKAFVAKRQDVVEDINKRILNTQVQIAICARELKKQGYSNPNSTIGSTVNRRVEIREYTPMNFDGLDPERLW